MGEQNPAAQLAMWAALKIVHLWECPEEVREYLQGGHWTADVHKRQRLLGFVLFYAERYKEEWVKNYTQHGGVAGRPFLLKKLAAERVADTLRYYDSIVTMKGAKLLVAEIAEVFALDAKIKNGVDSPEKEKEVTERAEIEFLREATKYIESL
jgi:hypothetical protein